MKCKDCGQEINGYAIPGLIKDEYVWASSKVFDLMIEYLDSHTTCKTCG